MSERERLDPRALDDGGLAAALRSEGEIIKPLDIKRDWVFYPLMLEALARLLERELP